ncbi:hypothetical protein J8273_6043 [Carpediemonas membranifera]|uniref:Uncharacterized protein n=1 Tax=Carpediemonas membranifera TaxID=201153 RepID=A0A8J6E8Y7_9EUKA|nr:hypothetical protein J8273_6043 [Carpediemonas membranifera]|eukprot:KAG9392575.1 hypothetical protein J8273_6043 [Carpediemonas membranifera]
MRLGMVPGGLPDESDSESEIEEEVQVESAEAEPFVTVETEPEQTRTASEQAEADPLVTVSGVGVGSGLGSCSDVSSSSSASSRLSSSGSVSVSNPADTAHGAGVPPMLPELALPQSPIAPADITQTLSRWTGTMRDIARAANTTLVRRVTLDSNSALIAVVSPHMVRLELRHGDSAIGQLAGPELRPRFNFPFQLASGPCDIRREKEKELIKQEIEANGEVFNEEAYDAQAPTNRIERRHFEEAWAMPASPTPSSRSGDAFRFAEDNPMTGQRAAALDDDGDDFYN